MLVDGGRAKEKYMLESTGLMFKSIFSFSLVRFFSQKNHAGAPTYVCAMMQKPGWKPMSLRDTMGVPISVRVAVRKIQSIDMTQKCLIKTLGLIQLGISLP